MKKKMLLLVLCIICLMGTACQNYKENVVTEQDVSSTGEVGEGKIEPVRSYDKLYEYMDAITESLTERGYFYSDGSGIKYALADKEITMNATADSAESESGSYGTTNVMTEGIDEGDILKNDGEYLYFYEYNSEKREFELRIVKVDGKDMNTVSVTSISGELNLCEFYLDEDQIILIISNYEEDVTEAVFYDITDRSNPKKGKTITQSGSWISTRMDNQYLYLVTEKCNDYDEYRRNETCVPEINGCKVEADCIYVPDKKETKNFVTCSSIALEGEHSVTSEVSVMSSGDYFYMSNDNMYLCNSFYEGNTYRTEIMRIAVSDGTLQMEARGVVAGYQSDTFCINEYDGYLRLVLSNEVWQDATAVTDIKDGITEATLEDEVLYSTLYVLDMNLETKGEIANIATGEQVYSVRFMGDVGYFVTFKRVDPLFSVDFTDPENPVIIGELKIPGFSEYLHPYSEELLLGIGYSVEDNQSDRVKLSMFNTSDPGSVTEENTKILDTYEYSECMYEYNALCIDPDKNIFGFSCRYYDDESSYEDYIICSYDEKNGFSIHTTLEGQPQDINSLRGTYIGNTFYTIACGEKIVATDLNTMEEIGTYEF